ncbi:hypothetical protein M0805_007567 [Coniferiporia weirii]|nr:hypothetical protein M0805_007567 [Coniferiporia weirii]
MSKSKEVRGEPDIYGQEQPSLTQEQRKFLEMLYSVLPTLVTEPKEPLGDPHESTPSLDKKASQKEPDPGRGPHEEAQEEAQDLASRERRFHKANKELTKTIEKFGKFEPRIHSVEGGSQLMDALKNLGSTSKYGCTIQRRAKLQCDVTRVSLESYKYACPKLIEAFGKFGNEFVEEKHVAPLRELEDLSRSHNSSVESAVYDSNFESAIHILETVLLPLSKHIDNVTDSLLELMESGGSKASAALQETAQSIDYYNMLIAATFFSAVTATTLQLSYAYNTNPHASLGVAVNTLWFVALVFSTASSLSSLVGLTWYQKVRRIRLLPNWAKLWLEDGPTISLAVASAAFSVGLCLFSFSSSQHTITSALTAAFTVTYAVALFEPLCLFSPNSLSRIKTFYGYRKDIYKYLKGVCRYFNIKYYLYLFLRWRLSPLLSLLSMCCRRGERREETRRQIWLDNLEGRPFKATAARAERDVEAQPDPDKNMPGLVTGIGENGSDTAISMCGVTDPGEGAALATEKAGRGIERADAFPSLESVQGPFAAISSTADLIPGSSSTPMVPNSDKGLENVGRQETDAPRRLSQLQEDGLRLPFDPSVQECAEEHNIGASDSASEVERRREGTVDKAVLLQTSVALTISNDRG